MAHPDVLIETDTDYDIRWYTVKGRHLPFPGAHLQLFGKHEEAAPDDPQWEKYCDDPDGYAAFKKRIATS